MKGSGTRRRASNSVSARMRETETGWHATIYVNDAPVSWAEGDREEVLEQLRRAGVRDVVWPPPPISVLRLTGDRRGKLALAGDKPRNGDE